MTYPDDDVDDRRFFERWGVTLISIALVVTLAGYGAKGLLDLYAPILRALRCA